jgi:serine/threonine-protein kinase
VEHAGQIIADLYRLEELLGRGAMGRIWRAEHLRLESKVAIKFLDTGMSDHPEALDRFVREARSAAAVRSAHVVQVFDCGIDDGVPYISMELLAGESLDKRLSTRGALGADELDEIFRGVAQAVDTAHELGVVHRDLKPGNIFIARERDVEIAKVLDFGIAKLMNRTADAAGAAATQTGVVLGTPYYMSPEQVRGSRSLDQRTDLWSLAVIAFECLTGELPFRGDSVGDIIVQICTATPSLPSELAAVPPGFDEWFVKGTSKEPSGRFATARQMAEALSPILARSAAPAAPSGGSRSGTSVLAPTPQGLASQSTGPMTAPIAPSPARATPQRPARAKRRNRVGLAAAVALSCVVGAILSWTLPPRGARSALEPAAAAPARPSSGPPVEGLVVETRSYLKEPRRVSPNVEGEPGAEVAPAARGNAASSIEPAAASADRGSEPKHKAPPELSLDTAPFEPAAQAPVDLSASASARRGFASRRGEQRARGARKKKGTPSSGRAASGKRRSEAKPSAGVPQAPAERDPFSERQ